MLFAFTRPDSHTNMMIFSQGTLGYLSAGINSSIFTTFLLALFSQYYLRKYRPRWFRKYNFLLSAALDGGTQVSIIVINHSKRERITL
jgi:OPT oligopeptide transporter protein